MADNMTTAGHRTGEAAQQGAGALHNLGARATDAMVGTGDAATETGTIAGDRAMGMGQSMTQGANQGMEHAAHATGMDTGSHTVDPTGMGATGMGNTVMGTEMGGAQTGSNAGQGIGGAVQSTVQKAKNAMGMGMGTDSSSI